MHSPFIEKSMDQAIYVVYKSHKAVQLTGKMLSYKVFGNDYFNQLPKLIF